MGFVSTLAQHRSFGATLGRYRAALMGLDSALPDEIAPIEDKVTFVVANHPLLALQVLLAAYLVATLACIRYAKLSSKIISSLRDQISLGAILISGIDVVSSLRNILAEARSTSTGDESFFELIRKGALELLKDPCSLVISHCLLSLLYLRKSPFLDFALVPFSIPYIALLLLLVSHIVSPSMTRSFTTGFSVFQSPWSVLNDNVTDGDQNSMVTSDGVGDSEECSAENIVLADSKNDAKSGAGSEESSSMAPLKKKARKKRPKTKAESKQTSKGSASTRTPLYTLHGICDIAMITLEGPFFYHLLFASSTGAVNFVTVALDSLRVILTLLYLYRRFHSVAKLADVRNNVNLF